MTGVRLLTEAEFPALMDITANAYPAVPLQTAEDRQKTLESWIRQAADPTADFYGAFRDGTLVGGMMLHDFTMSVFGIQVPTGGVGRVATDLIHKKQHIAKDLITFFLDHYRSRGTPFAALYPFRPDFYKQMGFGYGTKVNEYRVRPADLPSGERSHIDYLTPEDGPTLAACYGRYQARTHGLIQRQDDIFARWLANPKNKFIGFRRDGRVEGYLIYTVKQVDEQNFLSHDLIVEELVYEHPAALRELLAFLNSQADQFRFALLYNQDEHFHLLLRDPRNNTGDVIPYVVLAHVTNKQGPSIMYRVIDAAAAFRALADHDFGGQTLRLQITVADRFFPSNDGSVTVHFREGKAYVVEGGAYDAAIRLDVADFSSLLLGVVSFKTLYRYGLTYLSDASHLDAVNRIFLSDVWPICLTAF
jgi:predicted acetyltransferase